MDPRRPNPRAVRIETAAAMAAVAVLAFVPVLAGAAGILGGVGMASRMEPAQAPALDSHVRYLSGLLFAIGVGFWSTVPRLAAQGPRFRLLGLLVVTGGLARLLGVALVGPPPAPMLFGLFMELVATPLLMLWQWRIAGLARAVREPAVQPRPTGSRVAPNARSSRRAPRNR